MNCLQNRRAITGECEASLEGRLEQEMKDTRRKCTYICESPGFKPQQLHVWQKIS